jgi:hypothetical protein
VTEMTTLDPYHSTYVLDHGVSRIAHWEEERYLKLFLLHAQCIALQHGALGFGARNPKKAYHPAVREDKELSRARKRRRSVIDHDVQRFLVWVIQA